MSLCMGRPFLVDSCLLSLLLQQKRSNLGLYIGESGRVLVEVILGFLCAHLFKYEYVFSAQIKPFRYDIT